jgi:aspartyl-tRNA(Asn)/glutamyl-tRNA(Gln) amidotransferase subunit C
MMHFNEESLRELAHLCRIDCSREELERSMKNLEAILDHVDHLNSINTDQVPPCTQIVENQLLFLDADEESDRLQVQDFMKNVPSKIGGMIKVPSILKS